MFISDNILVVALILSFVVLSWLTYKSVNASIPEAEEQEDGVEDNSELELDPTESDEEFLKYAETVLEKERQKVQTNNKSQKLSEKLKNVRPTIALDVTPDMPTKPVTKNIRVNKKIKNATESKNSD